MLLIFRKPSPFHHHLSHWHFIKHLTCTTSTSSFLQTSCGLPANTAITIATKLNSVDNAQSVLKLLKQFSFTAHQVAKMVTRHPGVLNSNPSKILKPKLEFYRTIGVHPNKISANPGLLYVGLQSKLVPNLELLKSIMPDNAKLMKMLRSLPNVLSLDIKNKIFPRVKKLKEYNVPEPVITTLLVEHARSFYYRNEAFEEVKLIGIRPSSLAFVCALGVFVQMSKGSRERKIENYESIGWSREQVIDAFVRLPRVMAISKEKARKSMQFFKEKLDWGAEHLSAFPVLLCYSLEGRMIPRYAVWRILVSKGLLTDKPLTPWYFIMPAENFAEMYVIEYKDEAPELLDVMKNNGLTK